MEASGLTRSSWYRAIRSGQLDQLHPGVARLHGTADTPEQRIAAAVLAVGMPALASHRSAARLWGIERPIGDPVDVIVTGRRRLPALRGVVIHRPKDLQRLTPPQRRSNIACTNILRTLLDLGAVDRAAVPDAVGHAIAHHQVDFRVIGTPVILECDGWAYHGLQRTTFEHDRERDADLVGAGWIVVRFTYRTITTRPKPTADRIAAAVARWR